MRVDGGASAEHGPEHRRFARVLLEAVEEAAMEHDISEADVRNLILRLVQAGMVQERRAPAARRDLATILGPSLADVDPVPAATVEQARRLAALRSTLLRSGAWTTAALATARSTNPNNIRQWTARHRKADRIFTVSQEGESLVPGFLLDDALEPLEAAQETIRVLRAAGEDGWALWAWFASPSAWAGGRIPADLLRSEPALVAEVARQRAATAA